ncbi:MAG: c-type cytochrome [Chlorobium sp.]
MKRFLQLCTLIIAFFCSVQVVNAAGIDKADLEKRYDLKKGKEIYDESCGACHGNGVLAAPKFCDVTAWKPLIDKGMDTLVKHAIDGFNSMPANGGLSNLTLEEAGNVVAYMVDQCLF